MSAFASITDRNGTDTELYYFFICLTLNPRGDAALSEQELAESCGDDILIRVSYGRGITLIGEEDFWGGAHFLGVWCVINICVLIIFL